MPPEIKAYITDWINKHIDLSGSEDIKKKLDYFIDEKTISGISLLAFENILRKNKEEVEELGPEEIKELKDICLASVLGWLAYDIFDGIFDGEDYSQLVHVAHHCIFLANHIYSNFSFSKPNQKKLNSIIYRGFCEMYKGYAQEKYFLHDINDFKEILKDDATNKTCKFESLKIVCVRIVHKKSIGHIIGPLLILHAYSKNITSAQEEDFIEGFENYLVARQLHDDCRDYISDFKKQQPTYITLSLRKIIFTEFGETISADAKNSEIFLEHIFESYLLKDICVKILEHTRLATELFRRSNLIAENFIKSLVCPLEKPIQEGFEQLI